MVTTPTESPSDHQEPAPPPQLQHSARTSRKFTSPPPAGRSTQEPFLQRDPLGLHREDGRHRRPAGDSAPPQRVRFPSGRSQRPRGAASFVTCSTRGRPETVAAASGGCSGPDRRVPGPGDLGDGPCMRILPWSMIATCWQVFSTSSSRWEERNTVRTSSTRSATISRNPGSLPGPVRSSARQGSAAGGRRAGTAPRRAAGAFPANTS